MTFGKVKVGETFKYDGREHIKLGNSKEKIRGQMIYFNAKDLTAKRGPHRMFIDSQKVEA